MAEKNLQERIEEAINEDGLNAFDEIIKVAKKIVISCETEDKYGMKIIAAGYENIDFDKLIELFNVLPNYLDKDKSKEVLDLNSYLVINYDRIKSTFHM